jgi:hypothetical protein
MAELSLHDFGDGRGMVPAHRHLKGGGWVEDSAEVSVGAFVGPDAGVFEFAQVMGSAQVIGTAWVCGTAIVADSAIVGGDSVVEGDARVVGDAEVTDNAYVAGDVCLGGSCKVGGDTQLVGTHEHAVRSGIWHSPGDSTELSEDEPPTGVDDSAVGRIRFGWPGAPMVLNPVIRRLQGWELLIVLAVFPFGSTCQAVVDFIARIQVHQDIASHDIPPLQGAWLAVGIGTAEQLGFMAAAGLVCYLLIRSGEGVRAINLDVRRMRTDAALLLPLFLCAFWLPLALGRHIVPWLHLQGFELLPTPVQLPTSALTVAQLFQSLAAGTLEEIVVLGYLVLRLEQRGCSTTTIVLIAVAVRISYHLYYGWNALPIALWALVSVLVYLRVRRLLPFILCHFAWDASIPIRAFYPAAYHVLIVSVFVATFAAMVTWARWRPEESVTQPVVNLLT